MVAFSSGRVFLEICCVFSRGKGTVHPRVYHETGGVFWTLIALAQSQGLPREFMIFLLAAFSSFGGAIGGVFPEVGDVFLVVCFLVLG